jgi:hypothetical protein
MNLVTLENGRHGAPPVPLADQLRQILSRAAPGGAARGIEVRTWSTLPTGTGLGTILLKLCVFHISHVSVRYVFRCILHPGGCHRVGSSARSGP